MGIRAAGLLLALAACRGPAEEEASAPWTAGSVTHEARAPGEPALLTGVRAGDHAEYERVVIELGERGEGFPSYEVAFIDRPLHDCGSGAETFPVGDAWLEIRLHPADAHTPEGAPTIPHTPRDLPGLANLKRLYTTCDFEGIVTLVVAMESPGKFRVFELQAPRRIVIDVRK